MDPIRGAAHSEEPGCAYCHCALSQAGSWRNAHKTLLPVCPSHRVGVMSCHVVSACRVPYRTTTHLKQGVARHDRQEPLQTLAPALDNLIREPVREDLAGEGRDVHPRRFVLEDVAEGLKVRVPPADDRVAELEGRDVRLPWPRVRLA